MEQRLTGEFTDLEVRGEMRVTGSVDGVHVARGAGLTVSGMLRGRVVIEEDGVVVVNGMLSTVDVDNAGTLMTAGMVDLRGGSLNDLGSFAVQPGSMVGRQVLVNDGTLREPRPEESLEVNTEDWCVWLADEQTFVPMAEIRRRTAEAEAAAD